MYNLIVPFLLYIVEFLKKELAIRARVGGGVALSPFIQLKLTDWVNYANAQYILDKIL